MAAASYYGLGVRDVAQSPTVVQELEAQDVEKLTLFGCGLRSLAGLPPLRHLTELILAANELGPSFNDALFPALAACPQLKKLDVSQNQLESLTGGTLPRLEILDCSANMLRTLDGLAALAPALKQLDARENPLDRRPNVHVASALYDDNVEETDDDVDALVARALRASTDVPPPAQRRHAKTMASATTVQYEEARRQRLRADAAEGENSMLDEALVAAHARIEDLEGRLRATQKQVAGAERKASHNQRRAEDEARETIKAAASRMIVAALMRRADGASKGWVRDVFAYWRYHADVERARGVEARHGAACDVLRRDLGEAQIRFAAEQHEKASTHEARLVELAARLGDAEASAARAASVEATHVADREAALAASLAARAAVDVVQRAAFERRLGEAGEAADRQRVAELEAADGRFAHAVAAGAVAFHAVSENLSEASARSGELLAEARGRDASARQQLAELKTAYAALAARGAEGAAKASAGEAREAALRGALADVAALTKLQQAALRDATAKLEGTEARRRDGVVEARRLRETMETLQARAETAEADVTAHAARSRDGAAEAARLHELVEASMAAAEEARSLVAARDGALVSSRDARAAADAVVKAVARERLTLHESVENLGEALDTARQNADTDERKLRASREAERHLRGVVTELRAHPRDEGELEDIENKLKERERDLKYAEAELVGLSSVFEEKERDLRAGLDAERRRLEDRARDAVGAAEESAADAINARALVGELRARLREALVSKAPVAPEETPPPPSPPAACPY